MTLGKDVCARSFASLEKHGVDPLEIMTHFETIAQLVLDRIRHGQSKGFTNELHVSRDMQALHDNSEVTIIKERLHYLERHEWFQLWQSAVANAYQRFRTSKKRNTEQSQPPDDCDTDGRQKKPKHGRAKTKPQKQNRSAVSLDSDDSNKNSQSMNDNDKNKKYMPGIEMPPLAQIHFHVESVIPNDNGPSIKTASVRVFSLAQEPGAVITTRDLSFKRFPAAVSTYIEPCSLMINIYYKWQGCERFLHSDDDKQFHMALEEMLLASDEVSVSMEWIPTQTPLLVFYVQYGEDYAMDNVTDMIDDMTMSPRQTPSPDPTSRLMEGAEDDGERFDDSPGRQNKSKYHDPKLHEPLTDRRWAFKLRRNASRIWRNFMNTKVGRGRNSRTMFGATELT